MLAPLPLERCPACRARLGGEPVCARCACDLSLAQRAHAQALHLACQALRARVEGDYPAACALAGESLALWDTSLARALLRLLERGHVFRHCHSPGDSSAVADAAREVTPEEDKVADRPY